MDWAKNKTRRTSVHNSDRIFWTCLINYTIHIISKCKTIAKKAWTDKLTFIMKTDRFSLNYKDFMQKNFYFLVMQLSEI